MPTKNRAQAGAVLTRNRKARLAHVAAPLKTRSKHAKRGSLDRAAWIAEARRSLVAGGIASVKLGKLAINLAVTRESFYHHFKDLSELHEELLKDWDEGNAASYESLLDPGDDSAVEFAAMEKMWLNEAAYSPAWDAAVRDWARVSTHAARVLRRVDERRLAVIQKIFTHAGYRASQALVRARIYYFHQVGYYTVKPDESHEERLKLYPIYAAILKGDAQK